MSVRPPPHGLAWLLVCLLFLTAAAAPKPAPTKVKLGGTVVDDRGQPVEGAVVTGTLATSRSQGRLIYNKSVPLPDLVTDARGAFHLEFPGTSASLIVHIHARHKNAFTARPLELKGDAIEKPITLKVSPSNARGLRVRVVDEESKPVAGAAITVRYRPRDLPSHQESVKLTRYAGQVTDRQGRFEIPPRLDPDGLYQIEVKAKDFLEDRTLSRAPVAEPILDFGDLTLRKPHPLQGQVLDRQGKPVAGARVLHVDDRNRIETVTDGEGRFRLTSGLFPPGFLFVDKAGFRFHGQRFDRPDPVKVTLVRREEKVTAKMATLPPALPRSERRKLAARVLEPLVKNTPDRGDVRRSAALETLGRLDPGRMIEELSKKPFRDPWRDSCVRLGAVEALMAESPEEARTLIASMKDPDWRARAYLEMCDALPQSKRAEKINLLDQALLHVRAIEASARRVTHVGAAARRLWALGEKERATKLLWEGDKIARQLPTRGSGSSARGAFAEDLALIDLAAALALMDDLPSFEKAIHRGNLAGKLAGSDPGAAEHVLNSLLREDDSASIAQLDWARHAPQVCYRMAPTDLPRARKLADKVSDPYIKARTYGVMAQALAQRRPKEARALLERAFEVLQEQVASGKDRFNYRGGAACVAGLLIPVVEEIDADLVPEYLWRALSLHGAASPRAAGDEASLDFAVRRLGELALVLARYDRELALVFAAEARAAAPQASLSRLPYLLSAALADPHRVADLVEEVPEGRDKDTARLGVANLLLAERQAVWKRVHRALYQWFADDDDF